MASRTTVHVGSGRAERTLTELAKLRELEFATAIKGDYPGRPGLTVAQVAAWQEYGTDRVPARPALRTASYNNRDVVAKIFADEVRAIIDGNRLGHTAGRRVAKAMAESIVKAIDESPNWAEPLKPATIERKERRGARAPTHPLIDTETYRKSVHWRVSRNGQVVEEGRAAE